MEQTKEKIMIVLNIGHGGKDSGAIGADGTREHDFNRNEFGPLLKRELEKRGFEVVTVIQDNYSGLARKINAHKPRLILSLHFNAATPKATGTETLYWNTSANGKRLAELVNAACVSALELPNRGIKPRGNQDRGAPVLRDTAAPCVILEPFFGSNPGDMARGRERVARLAFFVARAVAEYFA